MIKAKGEELIMVIQDILKPHGAYPNEIQMEWYHRKTAFLHFGVNTFTNKEWGDGTEDPAIFNPTALDCRQWMKALKRGGFTAAILTTKHHDGFCLWPSKYTEHSVKNSSYKNGNGDVVREFVDACNEFGIKPGLYLSPWDRNHPQWGTKEYSDYYANQLTELLTEYGTIYEMWWDGAGSTSAVYDMKQWGDIIRNHQPMCFSYGFGDAASYVDGRWVGNEIGVAGIDCFGTINESSVKNVIISELNMGKVDGTRFIPAESDVSIRPGWFYHEYQDNMVKSPEELVHYWFTSVGRNTGCNLNLPITQEGLIHEKDAKSVAKWQDYMEQIFLKNLLQDATVSGQAAISHEYAVENLLDSDEDKFYVSDELHPTLTFELPEEVSFNCIRLDEKIELGHRVRNFVIEYEKDGEWKKIIERKCIGFCRSELFETVQAKKIRIRITEAAMMPALKFFGIYMAPEHLVHYVPKEREEKVILTDFPTTEFIRCEDGVEINFGGVFPFNCVVFNGLDVDEYELLAFNGTTYDKICSGRSGCAFEVVHLERIEGSYKIKLLIKGKAVKNKIEDYNIQVISE